jgi:K+-transporting ATPase KdpF subunit
LPFQPFLVTVAPETAGLRELLSHRSLAPRTDNSGEKMQFTIAAILAVALLAYLVYAMLNPEKFN